MTTSAVEIAAIMDRLREVHIGTSTFRALQDQIRALFRIGPDGEPTHEPIRFTAGTEAHGVILVAGPGTGKTTDLHHVLRGFHALQDNPETGMPRYLHISVASPATLRSLGCQFLEKLGLERVSDRSKVHEIWSMVRKLLQRQGISLVVVDEAHDMFRTGSNEEADSMFKMMKSLMKDDHPVVMILAGTERLKAVTRLDGQVNRRFHKIIAPPLDIGSDGEDIRQMIGYFAASAGLAVSLREDLAARLIHGARRRFGRCVETTLAAIRQALEQGDDTLTLEHFEIAWGRAEGVALTGNVFAVTDFAAIVFEDDDELGERLQDARDRKAVAAASKAAGRKRKAA